MEPAAARTALSVLHVMESTIGGTRRHIVDAARWQRRAGIDVTLAVAVLRTQDFRRDLESLAAEGVHVREVAMERSIRPASDWARLRELERLLRELRPTIVHTHSSKGGVLGRLASISTDIGVRVHTPHTFSFLFHSMFGPVQRRMFREIERGLSGSTAAVIAVSASEGETIRRSGVVDPSRVRVVANGIDPERWLCAVPIARRALGVPENCSLISVAGLLNSAKGQDLAIEALADARLAGAHLALAGNGDDRAALEQRTRALGLSDRVHFLGWREDVPAIFAASDVVLLPSRWEGMPYAVLEAMVVGRAVAATRVDGARDLIVDGRTGLLCDVESVASIAGATATLCGLSVDQRARMGTEGREFVLARYTAQRMASELIALYRELA